jgi:hypothetical protein
MTWTKLSDTWTDERLELSRSTRLLALEALVWSNRNLTDGRIARAALSRLTDHEDPQLGAKELVEAGLWAETATGWVIDTSDQPTAAEVEHQQQLRRDRQQRWLDKRRNASRDASTDALKDDAPPRPAQ